MTARHAVGTIFSPERSQAEISGTSRKYGAKGSLDPAPQQAQPASAGLRSAVLSRRLTVELDGVSTHREAVRAWASATRLLAAELGEGERSRVLLEVVADLSVLEDAFPDGCSGCAEYGPCATACAAAAAHVDVEEEP